MLPHPLRPQVFFSCTVAFLTAFGNGAGDVGSPCRTPRIISKSVLRAFVSSSMHPRWPRCKPSSCP
eukprot:2360715-Pyramimonas_sp.AAC.1